MPKDIEIHFKNLVSVVFDLMILAKEDVDNMQLYEFKGGHSFISPSEQFNVPRPVNFVPSINIVSFVSKPLTFSPVTNPMNRSERELSTALKEECTVL